MQTIVESRQTYMFRLETKEGVTPRIVYDYPIYMREYPDWAEFRQRLAALHADGFVVVPAPREGYAPGARIRVHLYAEEAET